MRTRAPWPAAVSAAVSPAAPAPTTSRSIVVSGTGLPLTTERDGPSVRRRILLRRAAFPRPVDGHAAIEQLRPLLAPAPEVRHGPHARVGQRRRRGVREDEAGPVRWAIVDVEDRVGQPAGSMHDRRRPVAE